MKQSRKPRNSRAYLKRSEHNRLADEMKHDQTRQRQFERRFESRDLPDSRAARADASDGGRGAADVRGFEARRNAKWYEAKIRETAGRLPKEPPLLQKLLWAVFRNGRRRGKSCRELGIAESTYRWGLKIIRICVRAL